MTPKVKPQTKYALGIWTVRVLFALALLALCAYFYAEDAPYEPYRVDGYTLKPRTVCPGSQIRAGVSRYAEPGSRIQRVVIQSSWQNVKTGQLSPFQTFVSEWEGPDKSPTARYGKVEIQSPYLRTAPLSPGVYRIYSVYDVTGKKLFLERTDRYVFTGGSTVTVLPAGSPRCGG